MATILEDRQVEEKKSFGNVNIVSPRSVTLVEPTRTRTLRQVTEAQSQEYEVVFAVDKSNINQRAFDFALESAKNFSARLVLLYLIRDEQVPAEFLDYAATEGIQDYQSNYYSELASEKMENLGKKADSTSVEWVIQEHFGDAKSAMKWRFGDKRTIFVMNDSEKKGFVARISRLFSARAQPKIGVQVFVF